MLSKIDQLLTRECVLCGDFLLDMVESSVIPDEPMNQAAVELVDQNSYTIDLNTGLEAKQQITISTAIGASRVSGQARQRRQKEKSESDWTIM